ncbi:MAG: DUF2516 family protein [Bifidobacteriaceae bacterium]|jgi:hypothetical protein|nr:DUF2516 family protein [Bifidobacteriaceae bacterium]
MINLVFTLQSLLAWGLGALALGVELWALIDAVRHRAAAFVAAGKTSKPLWLALTGVATAIGLVWVLPGPGLPGLGGIASIAAVVVAIVYLVDVRPAVRGHGRPPRQRGSHTGGW